MSTSTRFTEICEPISGTRSEGMLKYVVERMAFGETLIDPSQSGEAPAAPAPTKSDVARSGGTTALVAIAIAAVLAAIAIGVVIGLSVR